MICPLLAFMLNVQVSGPLVCTVEHAIRWKTAPMSTATCAKIADALNATKTPDLLLAVAINESDLRPHVVAHVSDTVDDRGLMGIRCRREVSGNCGGLAHGYTPAQLLNPVISIHLADMILRKKGYNLQHYNGGLKDHGYATRIEVLLAALSGVILPTKSRVTRQRAARIVAALKGADGQDSIKAKR